jgi:hypothetical protein
MALTYWSSAWFPTTGATHGLLLGWLTKLAK